MTNFNLGLTDSIQQAQTDLGLDSFELGRVILEHKERYIIKTEAQEFEAELMGNLRFTAETRYDLPAVGDWVAFMEYDTDKALIHAVLPRSTIMERKAVGKTSQIQIIATNIDYGFVVQAVDRDFNLNRLERYITICNGARVVPVVVLSKVDLINEAELNSILEQIEARLTDVRVYCVSNQTVGYQLVDEFMELGKTYCLLGSSGVGKSTLLNGLQGETEMKTAEISTAVNKGKHTTTHRELVVLKNGSILIDNPGMREVGLTSTDEGLSQTFESILDYANLCKYADCTHLHEQGCAILEALDNGEIDSAAYDNFKKMEKEKAHFESDAQERKRKGKDLGKLIKEVKRHHKKYK